MPDFTSADLKASRFTDVDLTDGRFRSLLLSGATFRAVYFPVAECLTVILSDEWEHRRYAERDLEVLTAGLVTEQTS
ncbi:MAG TPA: hypothetical protein VE476_15025 [Propionibacteriaceae bacterium]|nr:hypothetical protein [Propionibacteriaceae bacterium]